MKLLELISLSKHHTNLCGKVGWYSKWHEHPHHKHVHWLTFFIFVLFSGMIVYNSHFFEPSFIQADKEDEGDEKIAMNIDKINKERGEKEEKDKENKEEKSEKDLLAQAGIINIDEIATFIERQAENINKIDISDSTDVSSFAKTTADKKDLTDEEEKSKKEKEDKKDEQDTDNEENIENPPVGEIVIPDDEEDADSEKNDEQDDKEETTPPPEEPAPIEEIIVSQPEAGLPPAEVIPASDTATVLNVTSPIRNNKYRTGPMPIYVVFSKIVEVNGSPALSLATGNPSETLIEYKSGSGTNTLIFIYKIASTNFSLDLDYSSANSLSLNDGSIKDIDGNNAFIVLPAPGSAHSLSGNKNIAIDTILRKPTVL